MHLAVSLRNEGWGMDKPDEMSGNIAVLGAGIVGVCSALELQRRGAKVTLFDRKEPGRETSYGNAGVLARSSFMPYNNPDLLPSLPGLLTNRQTKFRYDPLHLLLDPMWGLKFLWAARPSKLEETTHALNELINLSLPLHQALLAESNNLHRLRDNGWMFLYRKADQYASSKRLRNYMDRFGASYECLDQQGITKAQPALNSIFERALWIKDGASVDDPGAVVAAYAKLFTNAGGRIEQADLRSLTETQKGWQVNNDAARFDKIVICLGPWSKAFLKGCGYRVSMSYERGYHRNFAGDGNGNKGLSSPVYDIAGGYVLAPMEMGLRVSSGTELADIDAAPSQSQMNAAEQAAREAIDLGNPIDESMWLGSRPTFPDSRPVIGTLPNARGLFASFGHQHVGLSTGPGSARLLAELMAGDATSIAPEPFAPGRFIKRGFF